jgi:hypothetical protein
MRTRQPQRETVTVERWDEKVRSAIRLTQPDPTGQPNRRWLGVIKTNVKTPPPLGVTMGEHGNEYDDDPPSAPGDEPGQRGRPAVRTTACASWLREQLADGPRQLGELRLAAEIAGFDAKALYRGRDAIGGIAEEKRGRHKWWTLAGHAENPFDGRPVYPEAAEDE